MVPLRAYRTDVQVALGFFALAVLSIATTRIDSGPAPLWIANSLLILVLKRRKERHWWRVMALCAIASVLATGFVGAGWAVAPFLMIANLGESASAALILRLRNNHAKGLGSMGWAIDLILAAGLVGPLVMAAIAVPAMHEFFGVDPRTTAERIVAGHGLSNIICIPLFALMRSGVRSARKTTLPGTKRAEIAGLFAAQLAVNIFVFWQSSMPLLFLAMLPSIVIAYRSDSRYTAASLILLALTSGYATIDGYGPIQLLDASLGMRLQLLALYLVSIVLTIVPISAGLHGRRLLIHRVSESEQRYRMLADHSGDIIMHTDMFGTIRFVSPSIVRVGGYQPSELVGTSCVDIIHPAYREVVAAHYQFALAGGMDTRFEYRALRKDGHWGWFESDCRGVTDPSGERGVVSVIRDIADRKVREDRLATAAMTDSLTGLPNRRAFREAAREVLDDQRVKGAAIAVIDIDHFKAINDTYGHDIGDEVLQSVAAIAQRLRRKDDMTARIGGEEFAILLPNTTIGAAIAVCERLRMEIADSVSVTAKGPVRITISGGVAMLSPDGLDETLRRADEALYRAKRQGRDRLLQAEAA